LVLELARKKYQYRCLHQYAHPLLLVNVNRAIATRPIDGTCTSMTAFALTRRGCAWRRSRWWYGCAWHDDYESIGLPAVTLWNMTTRNSNWRHDDIRAHAEVSLGRHQYSHYLRSNITTTVPVPALPHLPPLLFLQPVRGQLHPVLQHNAPTRIHAFAADCLPGALCERGCVLFTPPRSLAARSSRAAP